MTKPTKKLPQDPTLTDKELLREIAEQRRTTQGQFDTIKITIATAGLLAALGLSNEWIDKAAMIAGIPAYKLTLTLALASMASLILGFLITEIVLKSIERFMTNQSGAGRV